MNAIEHRVFRRHASDAKKLQRAASYLASYVTAS